MHPRAPVALGSLFVALKDHFRVRLTPAFPPLYLRYIYECPYGIQQILGTRELLTPAGQNLSPEYQPLGTWKVALGKKMVNNTIVKVGVGAFVGIEFVQGRPKSEKARYHRAISVVRSWQIVTSAL
jgi:hypothetical protein